jgi:hypothetical protein
MDIFLVSDGVSACRFAEGLLMIKGMSEEML